jgi:Uma2 family endonuclease
MLEGHNDPLARLRAWRYNVKGMPSTTITWHDILLMPEDGNRYEAIGGELFVTPPPRVPHQRIAMNLVEALLPLLQQAGHGELFFAPVGVEFPDTREGVQPDILFVSNERLDIVGEDWLRGAPDLVIEILSPGTAARDRNIKLKLYQRHGVAEYWIVDPRNKTVEVWDFAKGATEPLVASERLPVHVRGSIVGDINLARIFPKS